MSVETSSQVPREADGPLGLLPRLTRRQVALERFTGHAADAWRLRQALAWLGQALGTEIQVGAPEILDRAAGLGRPGVNAHLAWPRQGTRLGLGIETTTAHAVVDRLLGFERFAGEERLQVTPVEWGILTYIVARTLDHLASEPGPLGPWDLVLDRVGPEPFPLDGLGDVLTVRWGVQVGKSAGSVRLWVAEGLVARLVREGLATPVLDRATASRFRPLSSVLRAEAGTIAMPRGLGRLRVGGVLPIDDAPLLGTLASPAGPISLTLRDRESRSFFAAEIAPNSGGNRLIITSPLLREPLPREALPVNAPTDPTATATTTAPLAGDVPVTLVVELGRVNLPVTRLADLKPGDIVELGRHAREPVELTSNGRLVARGELVQIDVELGVRVTSVLL